MVQALPALLYLYVKGLPRALKLLVALKVSLGIVPCGELGIKGNGDEPPLIIVVFTYELLLSALQLIAIGIEKLSVDPVLIQLFRIGILLLLKLKLLCTALTCLMSSDHERIRPALERSS